MSWFQRRVKKPRSGFYNASSKEYACGNCAYYQRGGTCHLHRCKVEEPHKKKCGDFLRSDSAVPEFEEAKP